MEDSTCPSCLKKKCECTEYQPLIWIDTDGNARIEDEGWKGTTQAQLFDYLKEITDWDEDTILQYEEPDGSFSNFHPEEQLPQLEGGLTVRPGLVPSRIQLAYVQLIVFMTFSSWKGSNVCLQYP